MLHTAIKQLGQGRYESVLIDYCPDILLDSDPLNPFKKMWNKDKESRRMCELSMPAIRENCKKFDQFYHERVIRQRRKYTSKNFIEISKKVMLVIMRTIRICGEILWHMLLALEIRISTRNSIRS